MNRRQDVQPPRRTTATSSYQESQQQQQPKVFHLPSLDGSNRTPSSSQSRASSTSAVAVNSGVLRVAPQPAQGRVGQTNSAPSTKAKTSAQAMIDSTKPLNRTRKGKGHGSNGTADAQLWGAVALMQHMSKSLSKPGAILPQNRQVRGSSVVARAENGGTQQPSPLSNQYNPTRPTGYSDQVNHPTANTHLNVETPQVKLSLAQKMGLVEAPPAPPPEEVWEVAQKKAVHRGDALHPCSICHESFALVENTSAQVILDCSHVFHLTCLKQFEKFARKAQGRDFVRQCPVCRHAHYHKRIHYAGKAQIQNHGAAKIQSVVRGFIQRKRYLKMRLNADPKFKSDYYFNKLSDMADAYLSYAVAREKEVDKFLEEVDLQRQRAVADMMNEADWEVLRNKVLVKIQEAADARRNQQRNNSSSGVPMITAGGDVVVEREEDGELEDSDASCPICMNDVLPALQQRDTEKLARPFLLSCGHVFHGHCLTTFESFSGQKSQGSGPHIPRCPLCRAGYVKRLL